MKLSVITHVAHWQRDGEILSISGFVREMEYWAKLFDSIELCVPQPSTPVPTHALAYKANNVSVRPCPQAGGRTLAAKLKLVSYVPAMVIKVAQSIRNCDAIHVRCPGNMGLLGAVCVRLTKKPRCGKYAADWAGIPGEPWSCTLQRRLLASKGFGGPVTVNGPVGDSPEHVHSVFNSSVTRQEVEEAARLCPTKELSTPLKMLFVGRLSAMKGIDVLLRALALVKNELPHDWRLDLVGDGPEEKRLKTMTTELKLDERVTYHGMLSCGDVNGFYARAHILVLPSIHGEGWPKVLNEAMAYSIPCISTSISSIPEIIGDSERGFLVPPGDEKLLAKAILRLATEPETYSRLSKAAGSWIASRTLEDLFDVIRSILESNWHRTLKEAC